jgi:hypothetical protein
MAGPNRLHGDGRRDVGVAVAVAAGPGAEPQGRRRQWELDAEAAQHLGEIGEHGGHRDACRVLEVEERVAGLVDRLRPLPAQLVGQPEQVDHLGQSAVGPGGKLRSGRQRRLGRLDVEDLGDGAQLRERRPASRLSRVGGEDGPYGQAAGRDLHVLV